MMSAKELLIERKKPVCTVRFNRPEKMNSVYPVLMDKLVEALFSIDGEDNIRAVIISGTGGAFCSGIDLKMASQRVKENDPLLSSYSEMIPGQNKASWIAHIIRNMKKPVIAAINGPAIGIGLTIALACDLRIASDEARLGAPFTSVGLVPELGSTYTLPRLIGIARACELVFTGKILDAAEAKEIGLLNHVVPLAELESFCLELAHKISEQPPLSIQIAKRALYQGLDSTLESQLKFEALALGVCARTEDHAEGIRAFLERRKPFFKGK
jgi:2-(1,2-epoxy-1,2-dihydrophenyl)acetyl-CoA isomerase